MPYGAGTMIGMRMRNERGFTLVELLATIGAGIILMAAIYTAVMRAAIMSSIRVIPRLLQSVLSISSSRDINRYRRQ